ncbi:phage tail assembly chaperone [Peribacillus frigoritolerans]|uniref:phage tail assembly chaperone n=1 Tax=Peribacillus frigoritolerans TaxID=450367 RepID=UPI00207B0BFB|nr:phage tail assembly chaperone [Peribacillus frigoritolerans]MEE3953434.1 phage tail assembly chaperone [Peribacillus frigoritolerans]USK63404.1 phage tail assembly chaperone [Peribacillus frigoritolerans]
MDLNKKSLENALLQINPDLIYSNNLYQEQYKTLDAIKKDFPELFHFFGINYFRKLGEEKIIKSKKEQRKTLYSLSSIGKYNYYYRLFKEYFFTLPEVMISLNYNKNNTYPYSHIERFIYMKKNGYMDVIHLDHKLDHNEYFVSKKEVARFKDNYLSFADAATEANLSFASIKYWMKEFNNPIIHLNKKDINFYFILRTDWINFYQTKRKTNYISMDSAAKELGISSANLEKVAIEYCINYTQKMEQAPNYFRKDDINFLKKTQEDLWKSILDKYYTSEQAIEILGIARSTLSQKLYQEKIKTIFVPALICTNRDGISFGQGRRKVYLKKNVDSFIKERKKINDVNKIISTMDTDPYNVVLASLQEEGLSFSENGKTTKSYWMKYLKKKALNTKASSNSIRKEIRVNLNTSKLLIDLTASKEIFMFTTKELIVAIFNSNIPISTQNEVYKFIKRVESNRKKQMEEIKYETESLPNLYNRKSNKKSDKSIYTLDQFIKLIDYVKDVENHKLKAIDSIQQDINNETHYNYDSSWFYVLLHLNNAWRHSDVTMFPRIKLDRTRLSNMDPEVALAWLKQNHLNINEINEIINQVSAIKFTHSKTKKRRYFFCSEELKSAFVYSVVLCELRCRINTPYVDTLINFNNRARNFKVIYKKNFFEDFDLSFDFKSKQMNRTLISYIYSVITKMTNRNPLEVTKYIRSHTSIETTNIYIDIPQEQLDFITNQLFNMGHFGYSYDALGELLLNNSLLDREEKTKQSLMIKEVFGDVHQIEHLANYLRRLIEDQNSVKKVLLGYSVEERQQLSNLIKFGQQPGKKEGYQCIYSKCPFPSRDCEKCPFAIPHFYALSQLSEDFYNIFNEFKDKFPNTEKRGEKVRLANNLYSYLHIISLAKRQFGEENISSFFNQGLDEIKNELAKMSSQKHLVTIPHLRKEVK